VTTTPLRREHVDDTRRALLASARRRFGSLGFTGTSLDDVAADARVTKGALYHHFRNKEQLFLEVYDEVEAELTARSMEAAIGGADAVDALQRGFDAFLDTALDPEVRRIALVDATAVLGTAAKLEVDARHSLAAVQTAVEVGMAEGLLEPLDAGAVARLLLAACSEAALLIATAEDPEAARISIGATLERLLRGLTPR
jgi:AcrR family transcriptional regulator